VWLPRESLLTFEELSRLSAIFARLGTYRLRLTGGEPLLRRDLDVLVRLLASVGGVQDLALTTNGMLLAAHAASLRDAGLRRVTVSLDTLRPERFEALTRSPRHGDVLTGITAATDAGLPLKLNTVVMRGVNDDELGDLLRFAGGVGAEVRFIEYMDVGGATGWRPERVVSRSEMLGRIRAEVGSVQPVADDHPGAPADRFQLDDGTVFGIIASTTAPFCRDCDRSRVTADGTWFLCLYADQGLDLRAPLRDGASDDELSGLMAEHWRRRTDRGAEQRAALSERTPLYQLAGLRADPRREMHTRGG
jgi:cyclic pyranopterin phosphate synthase